MKLISGKDKIVPRILNSLIFVFLARMAAQLAVIEIQCMTVCFGSYFAVFFASLILCRRHP